MAAGLFSKLTVSFSKGLCYNLFVFNRGVIMGYLKIYQDNYVGSTVLSNRFIDEYMADANDAQLKIYLYLMRMMQAGRSFDVCDIADTFNHTEKDVMRALKHWEKRGVLALEYDEDSNLAGIRLLDADRDTARPVSGETAAPPVPGESPDRPLQEKPEDVCSAAPVPNPFSKPSYSLDDLKAFQEKDSTAQLLFIAEQYLGRTLSPSDMKSILFFSDGLHFSDDLIDYLLQYCVERGKKDFRYIEKVAVSWAEAHVATPAEAENHASRYDRTVYTIMNALGKPNAPTRREAEFIRRWREEYGLEPTVILEACDRTVLATDRHRFEYADRILLSWKEAGVHHKSDISRLDTGNRKEKPVKQVSVRPTDKYNRFMQNTYDYDELEKQLLSNN